MKVSFRETPPHMINDHVCNICKGEKPDHYACFVDSDGNPVVDRPMRFFHYECSMKLGAQRIAESDAAIEKLEREIEEKKEKDNGSM